MKNDSDFCARDDHHCNGVNLKSSFFLAGHMDQDSQSTIFDAVSSAPESKSGRISKKKQRSPVCVLLTLNFLKHNADSRFCELDLLSAPRLADGGVCQGMQADGLEPSRALIQG